MKEIEKEQYKKLAALIFPNVQQTVADLEKRYPQRQLKEGACVTRFAPSPTGFLHTGALFTTLVDSLLATQTGGIYYLRIEDTDQKREVAGCVKHFTEELAAFGLSPQEGVITEEQEVGEYGPYRQSKRKEIYDVCAKYLVEKGLAYPCFCTKEMKEKMRETQEANKVIPGYYGVYAKCRNISVEESIQRVEAGESYILRFRSQGSHLKKTFFIDGARGKIEIAENDQDVVVMKADGLPTYHFAHVVDDHLMRTTHVVRGEEWISSTPIHLQLFEAMGFEVPTFVHIPLIMIKEGESKRKLSKRKDKEAAVSYYLEAGYPPEAMMEYLRTLANSDYEMWRSKNKEADSSEFTFRLKKLSSAGSLLDIPKLNDVSKEIIARMDSKEVLERVLAWAKQYNESLYHRIKQDTNYAQRMFALERDGAKKIRKDIVKWEDVTTIFFYFFSDLFEQDIMEKGYEQDAMLASDTTSLTLAMTKEVLAAYEQAYEDTLDKEAWFEQIKEIATKLGFCTNMKEFKQNSEAYVGSIADFTGIIRIAITNRHHTPDIYTIMQILGKEEVVKRLQKAQQI